MQHQRIAAPKHQPGMSRRELLLLVGVTGVISAIAIPAISGIRDSAKRAVATQNAKNVAPRSESLAALSVAHVIPDSIGGAEATARFLREGVVVPEGPMAGERFILPGMKEKKSKRLPPASGLSTGTVTCGLSILPRSQQPGSGQLHPRGEGADFMLCAIRSLTRVTVALSMSGLTGDLFDPAF